MPEATEQELSGHGIQPHAGFQKTRKEKTHEEDGGELRSVPGTWAHHGRLGWAMVVVGTDTRKFLERGTGNVFAKLKENSFPAHGPQSLCPPHPMCTSTPSTSHTEWGVICLLVCFPHQTGGP